MVCVSLTQNDWRFPVAESWQAAIPLVSAESRISINPAIRMANQIDRALGWVRKPGND
jgi:hypothetical protein